MIVQERSGIAFDDRGLPQKPKRVLIVDDHPLFRHGIVSLIKVEPDFEVCGEAEDAASALAAVKELQPDVVLLDISLCQANGIDLVSELKAAQPGLPVLMLSMHDDSLYALRALRAGASGYVMKREALALVMTALRTVLKGDVYLSPRFSDRLVFKTIQSREGGKGSPIDKLSDRELEVLKLLGTGLGTKDIAEQLTLSVKTVETHRAHVKEKLKLKDAHEMVRFAVEWVTHSTASPNLPN